MKLNLPAWLGAPALLVSLFTVSCANRHFKHDGEDSRIEIIGAKSVVVERGTANRNKVPDKTLATAHELVPEFEIEEAEREVEGGGVSWSFEGTARGREIEIEIEEDAIAAK